MRTILVYNLTMIAALALFLSVLVVVPAAWWALRRGTSTL
jgi:hypothetical protein